MLEADTAVCETDLQHTGTGSADNGNFGPTNTVIATSKIAGINLSFFMKSA
jgi:hypothetical protein